MLTIVHVAETIKGGVATVMSTLFESKYQNYCVIPNEQASCLNNKPDEVFTYKGVGRGLSPILSMLARTVCVVRKVKPDVVYLHSSFSLLTAPFIKLLFRDVYVIYQPHGVYYDPHVPRNILKLALIKKVEKLLVYFVDLVISISKYEMNLLEEVHGGSKICLLKNSTRESKVLFSPTSLRSGYLFVGRLDEQKGIDRLIDFWRSNCPNDVLNVVGESVRSDFSYKSSHSIKFHGWVDANQLDKYYSSAQAVIVPSRWEGFGLVAIEAFRNGTPVIASDRGALPELVTHAVTGYTFEFDDFDASLRRSMNLLSQTDDLVSMYENCYMEYVKSYSNISYIDRFENIVDGLVNVY